MWIPRSIKMRTLALIVPVVVLILGIINIFTYLDTKNTLNQQIELRMNHILESVTKSIENSLLAHSKIPELLSKQIELFPSNYSLENYGRMFRNAVQSNEGTLGAGVYFEPYKYKTDLKYFSIYVYWDNDKLKATQAYSDPSYNYPSQEWYKMVTNTDKKVVFSNPYYDDESNITMVTTSAPFYDNQHNLLGVTTADINLSQIQKMIEEITVEKSGHAILIDGEGTYIAASEIGKVMKVKINNDPNPTLASFANEIMEGSSGVLHFKDNADDQSLFFKKVPNTTWTLALVVPDKELYSSVSSILMKQIIVSLVGILLIITVILLYSRWIVRNLNKLNDVAQSVANGDLSLTLEAKTQDEFGQLTRVMNQMQENLRGMISKISNASEIISRNSGEILQSANEVKAGSGHVTVSMQELAMGSEKLANNTINLVTIMDTFTTKVQETNENGDEVKMSSREVLQMTNEGKRLMETSSQQMMKIDEIVQEAVLKMEKLDSHSQEISNLIIIIKDIADKTNLLALNAAIEAARVGEHGKGFAVVADEVRKLAEQVATSIEGITGFVTNIQSESKRVSESLQTGYIEVEKGTIQIKNTGDTFNYISSSVLVMVNRIESISESLSIIAEKCLEMNCSIEELAPISQESAAGVEQTFASSQQINSSMEEVTDRSEQLAKLAGELNQVVRQFKIL